MASHRMRVCVGYREDGSPITTQIRATTETELADKVVHVMLQSERLYEFLRSVSWI